MPYKDIKKKRESDLAWYYRNRESVLKQRKEKKLRDSVKYVHEKVGVSDKPHSTETTELPKGGKND